MRKIRLVGRLDIKGPNLIKSVRFEGLRIIGLPKEYAIKYYLDGIDELLYMDTVATLYRRNNLLDFVKEIGKNVFIPMTVGGGIRSVEDVHKFLNAGADKIAINTAAVNRPEIIQEISKRFGRQCLVISIEAKRVNKDKWEIYTHNGREKTGVDVVDWAKKAVSLGAGEILLTSIDQDGTGKGFDLDLISNVKKNVSVPIIVSGGMGKAKDLINVVSFCDIESVALATVLHKNIFSIRDLKKILISQNFRVRQHE